ncbi:MAG: menaquinone biosynthetic enzyme MqnA/MqnD family protein [Bacteroidota bacterium]
MSDKISISIVNYTNTIPFRYGLNKFFTDKEIDLQMDIPAICANKIIEKKVDIGLVPVAILTKHPELKIISDYCVGALGKVDSVNLYSQKPIQELKKIILDYQSRTSVQLVKILCEEFWKIQPEFINGEGDFIPPITDDTGAVVIGDRTFGLKGKFTYTYDLSETWHKHTGLPFVFACWVSFSNLKEEFLRKFNDALTLGINNIKEAILSSNNNNLNFTDCNFYLNERINYHLDEKKREALKLFLSKLR